jgi:uncharacterized protein YjbI with pentapeptide repeats
LLQRGQRQQQPGQRVPGTGREDRLCTGVQVEPFGHCGAHLIAEELGQALGSLGPRNDLDLRGTTLDARLLKRILSTFRDPNTHKLQLGDTSLENAIIDATAPFGSAVLNGPAHFFGAEFKDKADFYGAEFKAYAGFNEAEFRYADFEKAKFWDWSTSGPQVSGRGQPARSEVRRRSRYRCVSCGGRGFR